MSDQIFAYEMESLYDIQSMSDRDRRSPFGQKIAVRSAIAKSKIGIAKNAIFLAIVDMKYRTLLRAELN